MSNRSTLIEKTNITFKEQSIKLSMLLALNLKCLGEDKSNIKTNIKRNIKYYLYLKIKYFI